MKKFDHEIRFVAHREKGMTCLLDGQKNGATREELARAIKAHLRLE